MLGFEALAAAYFGGLTLLAPFTRTSRVRQVAVMLASGSMAAAPALAAAYVPTPIRSWLPVAYLVVGYWLPAALVRRPVAATAFERWLCGTDQRLRRWWPDLPPTLGHAGELAYLTCYPLVPAAFVVVWVGGTPADIERFWTAVLMAGYGCYVTLPWLVSRPPRLVQEAAAAPRGVRAINLFVLGRASHQLNTFPSGHVAVSAAAAAVVFGVSEAAGTILAVLSVGIGVGAIAGRYHYIADVLGAFAMVPVVLAGARVLA